MKKILPIIAALAFISLLVLIASYWEISRPLQPLQVTQQTYISPSFGETGVVHSIRELPGTTNNYYVKMAIVDLQGKEGFQRVVYLNGDVKIGDKINVTAVHQSDAGGGTRICFGAKCN